MELKYRKEAQELGMSPQVLHLNAFWSHADASD